MAAIEAKRKTVLVLGPEPHVRADGYDVPVKLGVFPRVSTGGDGHCWERPHGRP